MEFATWLWLFSAYYLASFLICNACVTCLFLAPPVPQSRPVLPTHPNHLHGDPKNEPPPLPPSHVSKQMSLSLQTKLVDKSKDYSLGTETMKWEFLLQVKKR